MKCKKCHGNMEKKEDKSNTYYWQCPRCFNTVGKKEKKDEA